MKDSKGRFVKGHKVLEEWLPKMLEGSKRGNQFLLGNKVNLGRMHDESYSEKCRQREFRKALINPPKHLDDIYEGIRHLGEYRKWMQLVYQNDGFKCKKCGIHSKKLCAHHKKAFGLLVKEFLAYYNQFSWIDDREILIRLSLSWAPFWDILNGGTLCTKCHDGFHLIYGRKGDNTEDQWNEFLGQGKEIYVFGK